MATERQDESSVHQCLDAGAERRHTDQIEGHSPDSHPSSEQSAGRRIADSIDAIHNEQKSDNFTTSRWYKRNFVVGILGLAAVVIYTIVNGVATCEMKRSAEAAVAANQQAAKQWNAQHRPWVTAEVEFSHNPTIFFYPNNPLGYRLQVNAAYVLTLSNAGTAPAFHVDAEPAPVVSDTVGGPTSLEPAMASACKAADSNSKRVGEAIFPNTPEQKPELPMAIGTPFAQLDEVKRIWVGICIAYSGTTHGEDLHHTKIWLASWPINTQPLETGRNNTLIQYAWPAGLRWSLVKTDAN